MTQKLTLANLERAMRRVVSRGEERAKRAERKEGVEKTGRSGQRGRKGDGR